MNLDDIMRDKQEANGAFEDVAQLAQGLKFAIRRGKNWDTLPPESKEALEQISSRMAMILTGDAADHDQWNKLAIYARLRGRALSDKLEDDVGRIARERTLPPRAPRPLTHFDPARPKDLGDA